MSRIPAIAIFFCAVVISILVSVSLPLLPVFDFVRSHLPDAQVQNSSSVQNASGVTEIRYGIWAPCYYTSDGARTCLPASHAYSINVQNGNGEVAVVDATWTRGLVIHPIATIVLFIGWLLALFSSNRFMVIATLIVMTLAALFTLIAFAVDIVLFARVKVEFDQLGAGYSTKTGPGFWLTLVTLLLIFIGGCALCFAHKRKGGRFSNATDTTTNTNPDTKRRFWQRRGKQQ